MTGHSHLGNFCLPREDHSEDCPLCGEPYSKIHFVIECKALVDLRSQWLALSAWGRGGLRVEMCAERNGKKRERERNWKERVSFLSRSYKF